MNDLDLSTFTSESLRTRLRELEGAADRAAAVVLEAQARHDAAIKDAVLSGDLDGPARTESILIAARSTHARTVETVEQAKRQIAEAEAAEKAELQAVARVEIDAELVDLAEIAAEIDRTFAAAIAKAMEIRTRELAIRLRTREIFSEASGGPLILTALNSMASHLRAAANGLEQDPPAHVSKAVASSTHQILRATGNA
ncbi:hypothetical protein [Siccirubricoccus phaeus]|uniref:hypothetical protein n=1 Tax=Siccirubricoccus phaeus TaxID=2595053 RepID=UPI0011F14191|nr:hypothetical protein [Siccirubricoccus phaeus]